MNTKNLFEYNFNFPQQLEKDAIFELAVKYQLGNHFADAK